MPQFVTAFVTRHLIPNKEESFKLIGRAFSPYGWFNHGTAIVWAVCSLTKEHSTLATDTLSLESEP